MEHFINKFNKTTRKYRFIYFCWLVIFLSFLFFHIGIEFIGINGFEFNSLLNRYGGFLIFDALILLLILRSLKYKKPTLLTKTGLVVKGELILWEKVNNIKQMNFGLIEVVYETKQGFVKIWIYNLHIGLANYSEYLANIGLGEDTEFVKELKAVVNANKNKN